MADWKEKTLEGYKAKGFASRSGFGRRPGLLIVDFINGFTDPNTPLGGNFDSQIEATRELLSVFRRESLPIAYTIIEYEHDYSYDPLGNITSYGRADRTYTYGAGNAILQRRAVCSSGVRKVRSGKF